MYLKSLTLKGFKSFADRIQLTLEPGMTAVVGPNGSGKSNISDAVLWVLGERNPKHLRGQAMEDVIFAGSTARRSVSVAEVELVLDNSDGMLPVDFDEVSLTRRIFRSGESEYLINGIVARRMDFMDILHDTGLGTGTHTIIGQGNLDAVLTGKPEDRRALIEEAAGILKHKQRKERSARKLASMDEHLARVKDVAAEVERQLKPLARKASRQQAYEALSTELTQMDLLLAVDDLRRLRTAWDAVERAEKEAAAKIDVDRLASEDADARVQKLSQLLQDRGLYVGDLTERRG
ncbi:AAA family ATPase, partial [Slackia exigua]